MVSTPTNEPPRLISAKEVSEILSISQRTLWRMLSAGRMIPPIRLGRVVRWRADEVTQWIANGCPQSTIK